jgi:hypothetical protein
MSSTRFSKMFTGVGLAATLAASLATPVSAAPLVADLGLAKSVPATTEQVRCDGCWVAGGVAAGVLAGAAIAGAARGPYYRDQYYYDEPPVVYAPAPRVYYAPAPRYAYGSRCWVQSGPYRGQGYYTRC